VCVASDSEPTPRLRPRPPRASFAPRFTVAILYLFGFFFVYCFLLVAPELWSVWRHLAPGPEQQQAAREAAQRALQPRLWIAFAAAVASVAIGLHRGVLPGARFR
jgi:hypothetical protein